MQAQYISHMGEDLSVVNAARVSFDKTSEWEWECCGKPFQGMSAPECCGLPEPRLKDADARLIRYLAKHDHWTPFAHTSISLRMKAPVPIRTQCFKHKQGLVENEESRRYISSTPELFVPEYFRAKPEGSIKQGSGEKHPHSDGAKEAYVAMCMDAIALYESFVEGGICPEQARFVLPQGCQVNWIWTGNLYAFANFYLKRTDPHAQVEIQQLAKQVGEIIEPLFPTSWKALTQQ
jgi:thymidylate synthase (FAD)